MHPNYDTAHSHTCTIGAQQLFARYKSGILDWKREMEQRARTYAWLSFWSSLTDVFKALKAFGLKLAVWFIKLIVLNRVVNGFNPPEAYITIVFTSSSRHHRLLGEWPYLRAIRLTETQQLILLRHYVAIVGTGSFKVLGMSNYSDLDIQTSNSASTSSILNGQVNVWA